jgi:lipoprotein-anchoring transpeptidase ErfK/SrfK
MAPCAAAALSFVWSRKMRPFLIAIAALIASALLPAAASANVQARISKSTQTMSVYVNGSLYYSWPVSTGRGRYATPSGSFRPQRLEKRWYSTKYRGAPMHNAVFYSGGYAIHATTEVGRLGMPASHGCIRLHPSHAAQFYALVRSYGAGRTRITIGR